MRQIPANRKRCPASLKTFIARCRQTVRTPFCHLGNEGRPLLNSSTCLTLLCSTSPDLCDRAHKMICRLVIQITDRNQHLLYME
jgi:hypothetical protein